ncbi:YafY family protein [uncultured Clostridium sp.]|uniref:helix-turn-helix transcriptional regulator n=1 Tax=uncultured Clostridium sp. TaxID=59620 RepID=UPI00258D4291|nr:YafY family protein [uncultured Clostridium sp.]
MQINRLFEIVYILLNKKSITAKELSEHFEVSQRTIYRDIDTLCECGIPIYTSKGKGGGIGLLDSFILNKSILSEDEQNEILCALKSLQATNYKDNNSVLSKLSNLFGTTNTNWIEIDFSGWNSNSEENFSLLKHAILNTKVVSFDYYSSYGEKTTRSVEPLQLWFKDKNWYLKAFCELKESYRIFRLSRIKNLFISDETFIRKLPEIQLESRSLEKNHDIVNLKLNINSSQSYRVYDEFDYDQITVNDDNTFTVSASYPQGEWIYSYILSFGPDATVLEPEYVRNIIKGRLNKMINKY